jgi:hypothetical protein
LKANRSSREPEEEGVSVVVGAILMVGILVATLITVRLNYVPIWEQSREAEHALAVITQLASLRSQLDMHLDNSSGFPFAQTITMGGTASSSFSPPDAPDSLAFRPGVRSFNISSNKMLIFSTNGTDVSGLNQTWVGIPTATQVDGVLSVQALSLRVDLLDKTKENKKVTITITDGNGNSAGSFEFFVSRTNPDLVAISRTKDSTGATVTESPQAFHNSDVFAPYYVDVLDPKLKFHNLLAGAKKPLSLSLRHDPGMPASYAIAFTKQAADGSPVPSGTGGQVEAPFFRTYTSGSIVYTSNTNFYVPQEFTIANGAMVLKQPDGAVFRVDPAFSAARSGSFTVISLAIPSLSGNEALLSGGAKSATVYTRAVSQTTITAQAPRLFFTITTDYPTLWGDFIRAQLEGAGLGSLGSQPQFSITTVAGTPGSVTVNIFGTDSAPSSTTYDLAFIFRQVNVNTRIEG